MAALFIDPGKVPLDRAKAERKADRAIGVQDFLRNAFPKTYRKYWLRMRLSILYRSEHN